MRLSKDVWFGVLGIVGAALYWLMADDIQKSFLADEVGADGVPKLLALVLGVLSAATMLRAVLQPSRRDDNDEEGHPHRRAFGLLVITVLFAALLVPLGYVAATMLLIGGAALYAGQRLDWRLCVAAVAGSLVLWVIFDRV